MKTLNLIYICRVGIAVLAALVASLVVDLKLEDPLLNGISISLAIYILSYYVLKYFFMNKVDNQTKIFTMGIGGYFLSFLLVWVLLITPALASPQPVIIIDDVNPEVGETITFDASHSTDSDGEIVSYAWNFGDETTSDQMVVTHSYSVAGEYMVILTVVDDNGIGMSNSTTITVSP